MQGEEMHRLGIVAITKPLTNFDNHRESILKRVRQLIEQEGVDMAIIRVEDYLNIYPAVTLEEILEDIKAHVFFARFMADLRSNWQNVGETEMRQWFESQQNSQETDAEIGTETPEYSQQETSDFMELMDLQSFLETLTTYGNQDL
jgi:hypothetical protein